METENILIFFGEDALGCHKNRKFLHLGPTGVSLASRRGEKILKTEPCAVEENHGRNRKIDNNVPRIILNQVVTHEKINGQLQINSWESGSFWVELFLGSQAAVSLIAGIAWSGAVISKKIKEGKILEQQVKSLEIKNESLQDILEKQKMATDLLIEQEVRHLQVEHFDSDQDNEQFERLKMATKTFSQLIQQGAEVHPALTAPEQVQNVFPNYKNIETITSQIKLLENRGSESTEG